MTNSLYFELVRIIEKYRNVPCIEIELRLGWKKETCFDTNICKNYYDYFTRKLNESSMTKNSSNTNVYMFRNVRIITNENDTVILSAHRKKKLEVVDFLMYGTPFDVRLSVCCETPVVNNNVISIQKATRVRRRARSSFQYKMWSYDLTHAILESPLDEYEEDCNVFEVELELNTLDANQGNHSSTYLAHSAFLKIRDLLCLNEEEEIDLKNIHLLDRKEYNNNQQQ